MPQPPIPLFFVFPLVFLNWPLQVPLHRTIPPSTSHHPWTSKVNQLMPSRKSYTYSADRVRYSTLLNGRAVDLRRATRSQLMMYLNPYCARCSLHGTQTAQVQKASIGSPLPEIALGGGGGRWWLREFCHISGRIGVKLQFPENNVTYKHGRQGLKFRSHMFSIT